MSLASGFALKGFIKKGEKVKGVVAPPEIRDIQPQQEEFLDAKPAPMTTAIRQMFSKPKPDITKTVEPVVPTETILKPKKKSVKFFNQPPLIPSIPVEEPQVAEPPASVEEKVEEEAPIVKTEEEEETVEPTEDLILEKLEELLKDEEAKDPYVNEIPKAYIPETRRGFSEFIKQNYSDFMLQPIHLQEPIEVGEKYPYQKFIREYIRQASPYRGILVYHGLGSGKTCSAIAASEALFATAHKKIIVMTPFSLRKNFLKEITFCGFRHFRLQNYWVSLNKDDPSHQLFATEVLNISPRHLKTAKHIWVPDFDQKEPNYNSLSSEDQTEIRKQILSILVYDAKTNPTGRIVFINYNGISANKLKEIACTNPTFFDDAVIVVDEIHNLVRLMTGKIEPYLTTSKGARRKIVVESIGADKWKPSLCSTSRNYKRGYLFYRLLLSARNTKIIGLSGTPLINFPEELGVLSNILHGYIPVVEGIISVTGDEIQKRIEHMLLDFEYSDYVKVEADKAGQGIRFIISLLREGVRKISNDVGVERIPEGEAVASQNEITSELIKLFDTKGFKFSKNPVLKALPLLPIFGEDFRTIFLNESKTEVINKAVLLKRLSGLISYYKGSRMDLMPKVIRDEIVRIPMSEYQQKKYSLERSQEIEVEKSKKSQKVDVWAEMDDIAQMKNSTSYRMGSRQICNFAFPSNVTRPRPNTIEDINLEAPDTKDIIDNGLNTDAPEEFEEFEVPEDEEIVDIEKEEDLIDRDEGVVVVEESVVLEKGEEAKPATVTAKSKSAKALLEELKQKRASDCKAGKKAGETYKDAIVRSKKCLVELSYDNLRLDNPEGLHIYSPKYAAILQNIQNAPGSSLVYSQFLDMEGIGIFRLVMDINGYAPIEIVSTPTGPKFSDLTEKSLRKGSLQPRYITFSGAEKEDIRRLALDVFNARFNELPESLSSVLLESGFQDNDNKRGQICRVFCITSAGAEGLSLKNVRAVHIMEPYWNDVRLKQVKGRAIRIGSHLDLPKKDQNVSIYTYVSVFGKEAQESKVGPMKIDETIFIRDSFNRKEAIEFKLPIVEGQNQYVLTSDEYLHTISEQKKKIIDELETVMKSSAVDCELNYAENKDGTFQCISLKGKVGDFLYHPDLQTDIRESASMFQITEKKEQKKVIKFTYKGKKYAAMLNEDKFDVYDAEDLTTVIGTMGSKDGKPNLPIVFM